MGVAADGGSVTSAEMRAAARLLSIASEHYGNHGCNDFELDNTDENWGLVEAMEASLIDEEDARQRRPRAGRIVVSDWLLMRYLATRLHAEVL